MVKLTGSEFSIFPGVSQYPGRHWLKWGQQKIEKVKFTHAWIGFRGKFGSGIVPLIYESTGRGVDVEHWDDFTAIRNVVHMWEVQLSPGDFHEFSDLAFHENGKPYSNKQLLTMSGLKFIEWFFEVSGLNKLREKFGRDDPPWWWFGTEPFRYKRYPKWLRPNRDKEHVCSETAGRMMQRYSPLGEDLVRSLYSTIEKDEATTIAGIDPDLFSPVDFFNYCSKLEQLGQAKRLIGAT